MHQPTADLPAKVETPDATIQRVTEFGAMDGQSFDAVRGTMSPGVDVTGLLKGLEGDLCQCPHWGYIVDGSVHVGYTDGTTEVNEPGEAVYWPPGHMILTEDEGIDFVLFSPQDEHGHVFDHLQQKVNEAEAD